MYNIYYSWDFDHFFNYSVLFNYKYMKRATTVNVAWVYLFIYTLNMLQSCVVVKATVFWKNIL